MRGNKCRSFSVECTTSNGEVIIIQKQVFHHILAHAISRKLLNEHLVIKERQFSERIDNARRQIEKFRGFIVEDRSISRKKKRQDDQNQFRSELQESLIAKEEFLMDPKYYLAQKESLVLLTHSNASLNLINPESQRALEKRIVRLLQEREQANRKPPVPTLFDTISEERDNKLKNKVRNEPKNILSPSQIQISRQSPLKLDPPQQKHTPSQLETSFHNEKAFPMLSPHGNNNLMQNQFTSTRSINRSLSFYDPISKKNDQIQKEKDDTLVQISGESNSQPPSIQKNSLLKQLQRQIIKHKKFQSTDDQSDPTTFMSVMSNFFEKNKRKRNQSILSPLLISPFNRCCNEFESPGVISSTTLIRCDKQTNMESQHKITVTFLQFKKYLMFS